MLISEKRSETRDQPHLVKASRLSGIWATSKLLMSDTHLQHAENFLKINLWGRLNRCIYIMVISRPSNPGPVDKTEYSHWIKRIRLIMGSRLTSVSGMWKDIRTDRIMSKWLDGNGSGSKLCGSNWSHEVKKKIILSHKLPWIHSTRPRMSSGNTSNFGCKVLR